MGDVTKGEDNVKNETKYYTTGFEDGGKNHKPRNERNVALEARKGSRLWREYGFADTMIFAM